VRITSLHREVGEPLATVGGTRRAILVQAVSALLLQTITSTLCFSYSSKSE